MSEKIIQQVCHTLYSLDKGWISKTLIDIQEHILMY